jgi:hypothetical protein
LIERSRENERQIREGWIKGSKKDTINERLCPDRGGMRLVVDEKVGRMREERRGERRGEE